MHNVTPVFVSFFPHCATALTGPQPPYYLAFVLTHTYSLVLPSGRVISPTQRHLPDNTQHSQETNIHASGGIRTQNPSKRAAAGRRFRRRGHWDRRLVVYTSRAIKIS